MCFVHSWSFGNLPEFLATRPTLRRVFVTSTTKPTLRRVQSMTEMTASAVGVKAVGDRGSHRPRPE